MAEQIQMPFKSHSMMIWAIAACSVFIMMAGKIGRSAQVANTKGVYMLLDTSDSNTLKLKKASATISYLIGTLQPGDTLAVSRVDTNSFSENNIIAKVTFDQRPSFANNQKRAFKQKIDRFITNIKDSKYTDISGGVLQATEYLNKVTPQKKYILIFSDLKEESPTGHIRDVPFRLSGFSVIAINVTRKNNNRAQKIYMERVTLWQSKTEQGEGNFQLINDIKRLDAIFTSE
ncbi:MAG: VWA domain-containing protein [Desulfobacteraceae bacterium]|jgi:hypothetical protein